jgi:hypothetical protein
VMSLRVCRTEYWDLYRRNDIGRLYETMDSMASTLVEVSVAVAARHTATAKTERKNIRRFNFTEKVEL